MKKKQTEEKKKTGFNSYSDFEFECDRQIAFEVLQMKYKLMMTIQRKKNRPIVMGIGLTGKYRTLSFC